MAEPAEDRKHRGAPRSGREPSPAASPEKTEQLVLTTKVPTGEIVKVEKIDKAGKRLQLSDEECAKLAGEDEVEEIEAALEEAFKAGIAVALGEDEEGEEEDEETPRLRLLEAELFANPLVHRRLRRRLLRRLLLRRLARRRILRQAYAEM